MQREGLAAGEGYPGLPKWENDGDPIGRFGSIVGVLLADRDRGRVFGEPQRGSPSTSRASALMDRRELDTNTVARSAIESEDNCSLIHDGCTRELKGVVGSAHLDQFDHRTAIVG
jgi:hypothetical protein